jgi:hypothetical protein
MVDFLGHFFELKGRISFTFVGERTGIVHARKPAAPILKIHILLAISKFL